MANSVLLDTNIVIAALRKEARVLHALAATDSLFLPVVERAVRDVGP